MTPAQMAAQLHAAAATLREALVDAGVFTPAVAAQLETLATIAAHLRGTRP